MRFMVHVELRVQVHQGMKNVADAMGLWGLQHRRCFHNVKAQTKVLVAWNSRLIVLAARGTAQTANFIHDAKVRFAS
jgi:hypothetical protein